MVHLHELRNNNFIFVPVDSILLVLCYLAVTLVVEDLVLWCESILGRAAGAEQPCGVVYVSSWSLLSCHRNPSLPLSLPSLTCKSWITSQLHCLLAPPHTMVHCTNIQNIDSKRRLFPGNQSEALTLGGCFTQGTNLKP